MTGLAALATTIAVGLACLAATGRMPRPRRGTVRAGEERQEWLDQAGVRASPTQFRAVSLALGVLAFVVVVAVTGTPAVAVVPGVAAAGLPRWAYARRRSRRLRELQESWPDGIRDLLASISAGSSLNQALLDLAANGPPALREAFGRYPSLARVLGPTAALEVVREELADPTSDRIVEVLVLAHEHGGHLLADVLRDLADATTRDARTMEGIATASLEQRINARAVFVLPWLLLLLLTVQDTTFRSFYRSSTGLLTVAIGAALSLVGVLVVNRLSRDPVERRVLGRDRLPAEQVWS